jgi:DHA3 family macrolide efflux protein-like MFS transporter
MKEIGLKFINERGFMNSESYAAQPNWKRNAILFLCGQALSLFGSSLVQYAVMWHVTLKTQSGTMITLFSIAAMLPMFFVSPFGGVWADRYNRKYLINMADASIAFVTLIMAVLFFLGYDYVGLLLICVVVRALGQGIQTPAVSALIPQLVPEDKLTKFNGFSGSIQSACMILAPMASGAILSFAPIEAIMAIDVVTAAIGISIVFFLVKVRTEPKSGEAENGKIGYFDDMKMGFSYIRGHAFLKRFFQAMAVFTVMVAPAAIMTPLQVTRNFGADVWRLTAIEIAFSGGMMLGGVLIGLWGGFRNRLHSIALSIAMMGFMSAALGLIENFWVYLAFMALTGIVLPLYGTPSMVLIQTKIEPAYMGRVFSVMAMIQSVTMPASMVLFGPLADVIHINWIFIGTGIVLMALGLLVLGSRTLREAGA